MLRSLAFGLRLRWPRHSQQIETSSSGVDDVSQAGPTGGPGWRRCHGPAVSLAQRESRMSKAWRRLVLRRVYVSLPAVTDVHRHGSHVMILLGKTDSP